MKKQNEKHWIELRSVELPYVVSCHICVESKNISLLDDGFFIKLRKDYQNFGGWCFYRYEWIDEVMEYIGNYTHQRLLWSRDLP